MSDWITDRKPTDQDGDSKDYVWVTDNDGSVRIMGWEFAAIRNLPWMPITPPEPYVKPKRWRVVWSELFGGWMLREMKKGGCVQLFDPTLKCGLNRNDDEHREAAERIAAIYEELMP